MILTNTTDVLKIVTSSTAQLDVYISYADNTTTTFIPNRTVSIINTATTTTLLSGPGSSTQRQIKTIDITNIDGAVANTISVEFYDGSNTIVLYTGNLGAGQSIQYTGTAWGVGGGGGGAVSSVSAADGTLTINPVIGSVTAKINLTNANTWIGQQTFSTSAPVFSTMTAGSVLFAGASGLLSQDNTHFFYDSTNKQLQVGSSTGFSGTNNTPFTAGGSVNNYFQTYLQNASNGTGASTDFIAGADNDGVGLVGHYIDMGIQSSGNASSTLLVANDGYVYVSNGNINIGNDSASNAIKFFLGNVSLASSEVGRITNTGWTAGLSGTLTGAITFAGGTSGGIKLQGQAVGGTNTISLPAATGTIALTTDVITRSINSISTNTTAGSTANTDYVYIVTGTTTVTMPTAVGNTNKYTIKQNGSGTVTVATSLSQTIDGGSTAVLTASLQGSIDLISDGSNWFVI